MFEGDLFMDYLWLFNDVCKYNRLKTAQMVLYKKKRI